MKKIWYVLFAVFLMGSEDKIEESVPKTIPLTKEQRALLEESSKQSDSMKPKQKNIKGSIQLKHSKNSSKSNNTKEIRSENPYEGYNFSQKKQKQNHTRLVGNEDWIYGTAVITTTFLDGVIKRSYGILLHDGLYLTSANMVYNKNIYPRTSYAMMQDDNIPPFICIAKLSVKALDLQRGLAVLETLEYTDAYCNIREKSFYHDQIYSKNWIDVFDPRELDEQYSVLYSATISPINSFQTKITPLKGKIEDLARESTSSFEGYKYSYGKGYYTKDGRLVGIVGANIDDEPHIVKTKEIANFLCELKDKKILENHFLQILCPQKELGEK
ncbi:hypothetical protein CQA62_02815 [Helicobacter cholecystus]|uniref:Uncharacterized protein n=1 Tax=Helicobacter cholecystus TaxID=45498 RepID=A0A3D8IXA4_9HELI|nr:hypothetical protein [Helicobacter cholecystus]RDU69596.1 hypothetical protein CQA62_02815 [Helicobacter cholecystus]VEJ24154.1 periplasmic protein [Helicobacter cholecystus]